MIQTTASSFKAESALDILSDQSFSGKILCHAGIDVFHVSGLLGENRGTGYLLCPRQ